VKEITQTFKNKLFSNYAIYLGANLIGSAIPFLFLPILTRYLSPTDYGIVATFQILLFIFTILVGLNIHGVLSRTYFDLDSQKLKQLNFNLILISLASFLIIVASIEVLIKFNFTPPELPNQWLFIIALTALLEVWSNLILALWRVQEKPLQFGKFQISKIIINVLLSFLLVVVWTLNWRGRVVGIIIADIIFGSTALLILLREDLVKPRLNLSYIKDALFFGVPLIPHALSGWITTYVDRFFIANMVGMADVGIYSVAYQIGSIIGILASSFNQAWTPFLFKKLSQGNQDSKTTIVKLTYCYFVVIIFLTALLSLTAPFIISFFLGDEFEQATRYVPWIAAGYSATGMYYMVVNYIFYAKKTYYLAVITLSAALINILLNFIFISRNGTIGAAQATTITSLIIFVSTWFLSNRVCQMPWKLQSIEG